MADEKELLQAVLANPDDDAPRLAYADWCDARGNPPPDERGEFVRTQINLALAEKENIREKSLYLFAVSSDLLEKYKHSWEKEFVSFTEDRTFHRGFIACVQMTAAAFLKNAEKMFSLAPIQHLDLTDVKAVASELFSSRFLFGIRSLNLDQNDLNDDDILPLCQSQYVTDLRWLSLWSNEIGFVGARNIAASPHLRQLSWVELAGNPVDPRETMDLDQGVRVSQWLPPEGERIESEFGRMAWLHINARTIHDVPPNRF